MTGGSDHTPKVLFVCLGNICRSPMAEGALRAWAENAGIACVVDSAGTASYHIGDPPDPRAVAMAAAHGVDIAGLRARQLEADDFYRFDHILAFDRANLEGIHARAPRDGTARIALLLDWAEGRAGEAIADPYHGDATAFAKAWDAIGSGVNALAQAILCEREATDC